VVFRNFLAPIDDYTNLPFRMLCQKHGADSACVALVSAAAIMRNRKAILSVDVHPDERNVGVQLVGGDPEQMGRAAKLIAERCPHASWLNINAGCPSARTRECGGGSALLDTPEKIFGMVGSMRRAADLPVSVKIRIGHDAKQTIALCKGIEKEHADFIIIHGRTPAQGYSGKADWDLIKSVKESVGIPVIGNGDITSSIDGERMVNDGFCDSYMIGRAAMADPSVFCGEKANAVDDILGLLDEYLALQKRYRGDFVLPDAKAKAVNMLKGIPNASSIRNRICRARSFEEFCSAKEMQDSDVPEES